MMIKGGKGIFPASGNKVIEGEPVTRVLKYHHIGLCVSDLGASKQFYEKLGFTTATTTKSNNNENTLVLKNGFGMEIHMIKADVPIQDEKNILQDMGTTKYCGHTHIAFAVPSVAAARKYIESLGMTISGERKMDGGVVKSFFVRDLDRNTLEFERNVGDEVVENFDASMIGDARPVDHVGTRINDPIKSWKWYGEMLGFTEEVMYYKHDPEPLKRFAPWIARTESGIDINLLLNGNQPSEKNILLEDGSMKPGFLYAGLVVQDLESSKEALKKAGVSIYDPEDEQSLTSLGLKKEQIPPYDSGPSVFITDPDMNLYRLVQIN